MQFLTLSLLNFSYTSPMSNSILAFNSSYCTLSNHEALKKYVKDKPENQ